MSASTRGAGRFGLIVFLACVALSVGGVWYMQGGRFWEDAQEEDDDEEPTVAEPDAGKHRRAPKKVAPRTKKKSSEGRQARAKAPRRTQEDTPNEPSPPSIPMPTGPSGPSYESAIAGNNLDLAPGTKDVPDLTDGQLAGPMREGTFLDACGVPASMKVTVKVAIKNGRAVGISVYTTPPNRELGWCVEHRVRALQWPSNAKMDSFITTY
jgi:hypothetical protein